VLNLRTFPVAINHIFADTLFSTESTLTRATYFRKKHVDFSLGKRVLDVILCRAIANSRYFWNRQVHYFRISKVESYHSEFHDKKKFSNGMGTGSL
jgi:hypothetical protein